MTERHRAPNAGNTKDPARRLPGNTFRRVFFFLSARDICHASLVSSATKAKKAPVLQQTHKDNTHEQQNRKLWKRQLEGDNQAVWRNAVLRRWHSVPPQPVPTGISWKQFYRNRLDTEFVCFLHPTTTASNIIKQALGRVLGGDAFVSLRLAWLNLENNDRCGRGDNTRHSTCLCSALACVLCGDSAPSAGTWQATSLCGTLCAMWRSAASTHTLTASGGLPHRPTTTTPAS